MLHKFLVGERGEILKRSREMRRAHRDEVSTALQPAEGIPLFLDQLTATLATTSGDRDQAHRNVGASAAIHGEQLLRSGVAIGQVVLDYGSICQSVTEIAAERDEPITAAEFQTFNRCLDDAIAHAVTAYEEQRDLEDTGSEDFGSMVHEMSNMVTTSMLTFDALKRGTIGVHGTTSALLGNSLQRMRTLLDRTLTEIRLGAGKLGRERVAIVDLFAEIQVSATTEAKDHDVLLSLDAGSVDVAVDADRQILVSALSNLVQNAIKFTRVRCHVTVRAHGTDERVLIDVEDECGGLPGGDAEGLFRPFEQRSANKRGLGLGLSISRKGIRGCGGEIHVRDRPGVGCIFTIELPRAPSA